MNFIWTLFPGQSRTLEPRGYRALQAGDVCVIPCHLPRNGPRQLLVQWAQGWSELALQSNLSLCHSLMGIWEHFPGAGWGVVAEGRQHPDGQGTVWVLSHFWHSQVRQGAGLVRRGRLRFHRTVIALHMAQPGFHAIPYVSPHPN